MVATHQDRTHVSAHVATQQCAHDTIHLMLARHRIERGVQRPAVHRHARHGATRQRHPEVDAIENRAGVDPPITSLRPPIWRLMLIDALTKPRDQRRCTTGRVHRRIHRAQCTHHHLER